MFFEFVQRIAGYDGYDGYAGYDGYDGYGGYDGYDTDNAPVRLAAQRGGVGTVRR